MEPRDTSNVRLGVYLSGAVLIPRADFNSLPGIPRSSSIGSEPYNSGSGFAASVGGEVTVDLTPNLMWTFGSDYAYSDGQLDAIESFSYATDTGRATGQFNYSLPFTLHMLNVHSGMRCYPFAAQDDFLGPVNISGALNAGFIVASEVQQSIELAFPQDADFVNGQPADSPPAELLNPAALALGFRGSVLYDIEIGNNVWIAPGLEIMYALNSIESDVDWASSSLSFTLRLSRRETSLWPLEIEKIFKRDTLIDVVADINKEDVILNSSRVDTSDRVDPGARLRIRSLTFNESYLRRIPAAQPLLSASIESRFVLANGSETSFADLPVQIVEHVQLRQLLPILACDPGQELTAFEPASQFNESLVYCGPRASLDTLAQRLRKLPAQQLDAIDVRSTCPERRDSEWQQTLRTQLKDILQLADADKVGFENSQNASSSWRVLPVEFAYTDIGVQPVRVLAPAVSRNVQPYVNAPHIRFSVNAVSEDGISGWQLSIKQNGRLLKVFNGAGAPPKDIEWDVSATSEVWFGNDADLVFVLTIEDVNGRTYDTAPGLIRIGSQATDVQADQRLPQKRVVRFPLEWLAARDGKLPDLQNIIAQSQELMRPESVVVYTYRHHHRIAAEYNQFIESVARELGVSPSEINNAGLADSADDTDLPTLLENLERGFAIVEVWFAL